VYKRQGVAQAADTTLKKGFNEVYANPYGSYKTSQANVADQDVIQRRDYLQKLKDEAYGRYKQRFNTQSTI
jgi:hypothetical protein